MIKMLAIVNQSRLPMADVERMVQAVRRQITFHVAPAWQRVPPEVVLCPDVTYLDLHATPILIFDSPIDAQALGYHSEMPDGRKYARVFVDAVFADGGSVLYDGPRLSVASVVSHEACEVLVDPECNVWVDGPVTAYGATYALEIADPIHGDVYPVPADDGTPVAMNNFLYPDWFDPNPAWGTRLDHLGHLTRPFTGLPGGHMLIRWTLGSEVMVANAPSAPRLSSIQQPASRTWRRMTRSAQVAPPARRTGH